MFYSLVSCVFFQVVNKNKSKRKIRLEYHGYTYSICLKRNYFESVFRKISCL